MSNVLNNRLLKYISNVLDGVSRFQEIYQREFTKLLKNLNSIEVYKWVDKINIINLITDIELISSKFSSNYRKVTIMLINKRDRLKRKKMGDEEGMALFQKLTKIKSDLENGILVTDYKSLIEAYNRMYIDIRNSLRSHKIASTEPYAISVIPPKRLNILVEDVANLQKTMLVLLDKLDKKLYENTTTTTEDNNGDFEFGDELEYDEMTVADDDDLLIHDQPGIEDSYTEVLDMLEHILLTQVEIGKSIENNNKTRIIETIEDLQRNIIVKLSETTERLGGVMATDDSGQEINIKLNSMSKKIDSIYNSYDDISRYISQISADQNNLTLQLKNHLQQLLENRLDVLFNNTYKILEDMKISNVEDIQRIEASILDKIIRRIDLTLLNEENIVQIIQSTLVDLKDQNIEETRSVIQTIIKEFHEYLKNIDIKYTHNFNNIEEIATVLKNQDAAIAEITKTLKYHSKSIEDMKENISRQLDEYKEALKSKEDEYVKLSMDLFNQVDIMSAETLAKLNTLETNSETLVDIKKLLDTLLLEVPSKDVLAMINRNIKKMSNRFDILYEQALKKPPSTDEPIQFKVPTIMTLEQKVRHTILRIYTLFYNLVDTTHQPLDLEPIQAEITRLANYKNNTTISDVLRDEIDRELVKFKKIQDIITDFIISETDGRSLEERQQAITNIKTHIKKEEGGLSKQSKRKRIEEEEEE